GEWVVLRGWVWEKGVRGNGAGSCRAVFGRRKPPRVRREVRQGRVASGTQGLPIPRVAYPGLVVGLAMFTALLAAHGASEVGAALRTAGAGLLCVAIYHLLPMLADALGLRRLLPAELRPPVRTMLRARWIGESVNGLLPVLQVGGNVVKASLLARTGVGGAVAGASVVVDVTLVMLTQVVFTVVGLALLL